MKNKISRQKKLKENLLAINDSDSIEMKAIKTEIKLLVDKYNLSIDTAYRWVRNKKIPTHYIKDTDIKINKLNLREFRKNLNLSVSSVKVLMAKRGMKISLSTIFKYESENIRPPSEKTVQLNYLIQFYSSFLSKSKNNEEIRVN